MEFELLKFIAMVSNRIEMHPWIDSTLLHVIAFHYLHTSPGFQIHI